MTIETESTPNSSTILNVENIIQSIEHIIDRSTIILLGIYSKVEDEYGRLAVAETEERIRRGNQLVNNLKENLIYDKINVVMVLHLINDLLGACDHLDDIANCENLRDSCTECVFYLDNLL